MLKTATLCAVTAFSFPGWALADLTPSQIYQNASPAVVLILCAGADGNGELGTGSVIDATGRVLTNAHVVVRKSSGRPFDRIRVYFKPARLTGDPTRDLANPRQAKVVSFDPALDLALLELESKPSRLTVLPVGDSSKIDPGEPVVAIGHPEQGGLWTLTTGVVSTVIANLGEVQGKDVFQTDASINRGNSGGPLIDREGAMIGVNTSMARKASDGLTITSVNFSIKSSVVKNWLASIGTGVAYARPAPASPGEGVTQAATPAPAAPKPAAEAPKPVAQPPKPRIVTPAKPYRIDDLLQKQIAEMEDLEKEMEGEIESRRGQLGQ